MNVDKMSPFPIRVFSFHLLDYGDRSSNHTLAQKQENQA
ncbi:hypothetical protein BLGI_2874 [Brevibacillus laterosporus GI-9]|nr:hypothetical protein BLGI_2874 [Brevibacillus laterosporus GI-9]